MTSPRFQVDSERSGDVRVLAVNGELDIDSAPRLEERLTEAVKTGELVLVDLTRCAFIDSTGLAVIVAAWQAAREEDDGARLAVCCPESQVKRLFKLTGIDKAMTIHGGRDSAITALHA